MRIDEARDYLKARGYIKKAGQLIARGESIDHEDDVLPPGLAESLFARDSKIRHILLSSAPFSLAVAGAGKTLYPLLDDAAQLIGPRITCVTSLSDIPARQKPLPAILVGGAGCLCCAPDPYEALALAMVVEKSCLALIGAWALGGAHRIPLLEAWLMRAIYLGKYSRQKK